MCGPILINLPSMLQSPSSFNGHHQLANERPMTVHADQSEAAKWWPLYDDDGVWGQQMARVITTLVVSARGPIMGRKWKWPSKLCGNTGHTRSEPPSSAPSDSWLENQLNLPINFAPNQLYNSNARISYKFSNVKNNASERNVSIMFYLIRPDVGCVQSPLWRVTNCVLRTIFTIIEI